MYQILIAAIVFLLAISPIQLLRIKRVKSSTRPTVLTISMRKMIQTTTYNFEVLLFLVSKSSFTQ